MAKCLSEYENKCGRFTCHIYIVGEIIGELKAIITALAVLPQFKLVKSLGTIKYSSFGFDVNAFCKKQIIKSIK